MLRTSWSIEEALAYSGRWHVPILVFVHSNEDGVGQNSSGDENKCSNIPGFYTESPLTKNKKVINPNFCFASDSLPGDGRLQRRAFEVVLAELRLASISITHFVEVGTPAHELFIAAVQQVGDTVPSLHIFPPQREVPRVALYGNSLTPKQIYDSFRVVMQASVAPRVKELRSLLLQQVEYINSEQCRMSTLRESSLTVLQDAGCATTRQVVTEPGGRSTASVAGEKKLGGQPEELGKVSAVHCGADGCPLSDTVIKSGVVTRGTGDSLTVVRKQTGLPSIGDNLAEGKKSAPAPSCSLLRMGIRCILPDGSTYMVDNLDPSVDTLSDSVRKPVAAHLDHNAFYFASPHPWHHFTENEEKLSLAEIGMRTSSTLRVITEKKSDTCTDGETQIGRLSRQMIGRLTNLLGRACGTQVPSTQVSNVPHTEPSLANGAVHGSRFRCMADIRAEQEREELSSEMTNAKRHRYQKQHGTKPNTYYDGNSTEFLGKRDDDEVDDGDSGSDDSIGSKKRDG
ncbi:hypothetical protein ERJ75_000758300 [Trypanosoma vivax]|uniref:Uncharacterized protein n=2 Tax=Trypanosoma vivax (strain Y486) TaxID=1055687 RepID=G0TV62_TRYVY|nr:hypothetical protein TRVL_06170 [Trypanosoma vivax]KAH8613668.1 hypothetical protein ERJ75_000758300 [Trypanosoma vivax]CCC47828.1 conserved hypothetical protein [Trypanosoma vivax Y486]